MTSRCQDAANGPLKKLRGQIHRANQLSVTSGRPRTAHSHPSRRSCGPKTVSIVGRWLTQLVPLLPRVTVLEKSHRAYPRNIAPARRGKDSSKGLYRLRDLPQKSQTCFVKPEGSPAPDCVPLLQHQPTVSERFFKCQNSADRERLCSLKDRLTSKHGDGANTNSGSSDWPNPRRSSA